ncbi:DUF1353 domain-containing protein [Sphingomonas sp. S2-65]|uniref:DUF1353 domain-containing protein n=1 Tax=Sphingomonas sp. S2-65 TaxID=2903960 RepID=UPI001F1AFA2A|nr:DUF1353 domain-containing protein [Sphingomonas sp. S2-65]UYY57872.1 DUF1353 domain-containing protein [Sphingomonas sp. S2-65]
MPEIDSPFGRYVGELVVKLLPDGRRVQLFQEFGFVDSAQTIWHVPSDVIVDGASIPQALWPLMGGPFEGKYRDASVIHDYHCDTRTRPWKDVHRVFYDAMRVSGVGETRAKIMYAAVYFKGPRWSDVTVHNVNKARDEPPLADLLAASAFERETAKAVTLDGITVDQLLLRGQPMPPEGRKAVLDLDMLSSAIAAENPSLAEIEVSLDMLEPFANTDERVLVVSDMKD